MAGPLDRLRTAMGPIFDVRNQVRRHLEPVKDRAREGAEANLHRLYRTTFSAPVLVVMLLVMVTAAMGWQGQDFQSSIEDDVEIFLPDGGERSSDLLREVRSGWSTDIAIIWIQTMMRARMAPQERTSRIARSSRRSHGSRGMTPTRTRGALEIEASIMTERTMARWTAWYGSSPSPK